MRRVTSCRCSTSCSSAWCRTFPELGGDFLARRAGSVDGAARIARLQRRLGKGTSMRELIVGDFLVLYATRAEQRWLLAIRHHRQLSYDLKAHWVT